MWPEWADAYAWGVTMERGGCAIGLCRRRYGVGPGWTEKCAAGPHTERGGTCEVGLKRVGNCGVRERTAQRGRYVRSRGWDQRWSSGRAAHRTRDGR